MQYDITTSLLVSLSEDGFGLDELIYRMEEIWNRKAFPQLLCAILLLVDENLKLRVMEKRPLPSKCACACKEHRLVLDGGMPRKIRTRLGVIDIPRITRVRCANCGKRYAPLLRMCAIGKNQTKSNELEKLILEQCAKESYRVAAESIHETTAARESHSTFWRCVMKTDADGILPSSGQMGAKPGILYADGTKCKSIGKDGAPCKGDVKVLLGVRGDGSVFPVGVWTKHETWKEISRQLGDRHAAFPEGTILLSDGEPGLAESLSAFSDEEQRCHWHIGRDLYHMMRLDGGKIRQVRPIRTRLNGIMAIELPKESFANVTEEEKASIEDKMHCAEANLDLLVADIRKRGYEAAAGYLERAKHAMFGYVRRWLSLGVLCPRASSFIERVMRAIGRRIKKLGYNWKEEGVGKIARIVLKIFTNKDEWNAYWQNRMDLERSVFLHFRILNANLP